MLVQLLSEANESIREAHAIERATAILKGRFRRQYVGQYANPSTEPSTEPSIEDPIDASPSVMVDNNCSELIRPRRARTEAKRLIDHLNKDEIGD